VINVSKTYIDLKNEISILQNFYEAIWTKGTQTMCNKKIFIHVILDMQSMRYQTYLIYNYFTQAINKQIKPET
jgi:hypothetical protein